MTERFHPDEINAVESHAQTEHKLEVMRRYYASYASIIAQSKSRAIDNRHIFLVDLFAGVGIHRSGSHPDGRVLGTALQACAAARDVQRTYSNTTVHVRLVDLDPSYCERLRERAEVFRQQGVDVTVWESDYATSISPILHEISAHGSRCLSLWLVDPHGPKILAYKSLQPLIQANGVEIIINLDVTGIERMRGLVLSPKAGADARLAEMAKKQRQNLDELYRGSIWETPEKYVRVRPGMDLSAMLAEAYLQAFRMFRFKRAYPLRSSSSQFRYLIHLTKSKLGEAAFAKAYDASWKIGTAQGRSLTDTDCGRYASELFTAYVGMRCSLEDMRSDGIVDLDRRQWGRVLRYAGNNGFGIFENDVMTWASERLDAWALPPAEHDEQPRLF